MPAGAPASPGVDPVEASGRDAERLAGAAKVA
jgi:hypothetical protein